MQSSFQKFIETPNSPVAIYMNRKLLFTLNVILVIHLWTERKNARETILFLNHVDSGVVEVDQGMRHVPIA